ncbi:MAG: ComEC/Rec2 family competence protein [Lentisphaerae bacterium]|nr:ComEC/Rec2 family competence protein [Lentisphaerota bacterium]
MKINLKIPLHRKCKFQRTTVLAMGAGLGAACGYGVLSWWYAIAVLPLLILLNRRQLVYALSGFLLCAASGLIRQNFMQDENVPVQTGNFSGRIVCTDRRVSGVLPEQNSKMADCLIYHNGNKFSATAMYPKDHTPFYGDAAGFTGILIPPQPLGLVCENNDITGEFQPPRKSSPLIIIKSLTPEKPERIFYRKILQCRDAMLEYLLRDIKNKEIAAMAAQIFFGADLKIDYRHWKNFIDTGTVHLFSVSGLHVMLVAGMVLWLLKFLPFRLKHCIAAAVTLLYVLGTGAELPAIRAGCMVIIWCILRSILVYFTSWQALMLTWSVFVFCDPASTGSLSAQYSYGITAALILSGQWCRNFLARQYEILKMMPFKSKLTQQFAAELSVKRKILSTATAVLTAFAAGCGLTLFRQHLFTPGSIPANFLLILLSPLLFGVFGFKMLVTWISPEVSQFAALLLETVFYALLDCTGTIAGFLPSLAYSAIPLWSVMLFYLGFFGIFGVKNLLLRKICILGTAVIFFSWLIPAYHPGIDILVVSNSSSTPPLIAIRNPSGSTVIANAPDAESCRAAGRLLRTLGTKRANVILANGTLNSSRGLKTLQSSLDLNIFTENRTGRSTAAFRRMLQENNLLINDLPHGNVKLDNISRNSQQITFFNDLQIKSQVTGTGREIVIHTANGKKFHQILPWCSYPVIWQFRIK